MSRRDDRRRRYEAEEWRARERSRGGGGDGLRTLLSWGLVGGVAWYLWRQGQAAVTTAATTTKGEGAYLGMVQSAAAAAGVPVSVLAAIVKKESAWSNAPNQYSAPTGQRKVAVSCIGGSSGEVGLAQIMPGTAADHGVSDPQQLCDPMTNLMTAAKILRAYYQSVGQDWEKAVAAFNAGPGAVRSGHIPLTTSVVYVPKVMAYIADYQSRGLAGTCG